MNIRIEKRVPFGFKGEWGKVYKKYDYEESEPLAGTWELKEKISLETEITRFDFDFVSGDTECKGFAFQTLLLNYIDSAGESFAVYLSPGVWRSFSFRTLSVSSKLSDVENGEALLAWLKNNAEKKTEDGVYWQKTEYKDIGQDVQFKYLEDGIDKQVHPTQPVLNVVTKSEYRIVETADAYFDEKSKRFECAAGLGDIVCLFGKWWVVDKIDEKSIYTPQKQTFYFCGLKAIKGTEIC